MTRCAFAARAVADLEEIGDYIARDNPARAVSFVRELRRYCARIARQPRIHPLREEFGSGVRLAVHGRYVILYAERAGGVVIERIVHGARNQREISL